MSAAALSGQMSAAALSGPRRASSPTLALDRADRLETLVAPIRGLPRTTIAILVGSVVLHLVVVATAMVTSRAPLAILEPAAMTVEVVREVPKPTPPPAKVEPPKVEAQKVEPPKAEAPKQDELRKAADEREALAKELASLRAQQSQVEARRASADLGMGPLPGSFQAVALPSSTTGAGEAMDYKDLVFSQLAKARGFDERMGVPGTAGVHFVVDAAGALATVEIVAPSGVAALDREAIAIVRRAAPFPAPPQGALRSFVANVNFVVQGRR